jgi:photosystem II stability/assembly factor-like uncharacterized protein
MASLERRTIREEETMSPSRQLIWRRLAREPGGAVLALASDGRAVLAGTAGGAFLARHATDAWEELSLPSALGNLELANPVAIAPWGDSYIATPLGLFRQLANGTWQRCLAGGTVVALRTAHDEQRRLVVVADQLDGVLVSTTAGSEWEPANAGLPTLFEVVDLVLSPRFTHDRTAMLVAADTLLLSRSRRWSWHEVESPSVSLECGAIALGERKQCTLFAGGEEGLFRSRDHGRTWEPVALPIAGGASAIAADPSGRHLAAAFERYVVRSNDGGEHWEGPIELPSHVLSVVPCGERSVVVGTLAHGCFRWEWQEATVQEWNDGLYGRLPVGLVARRPAQLVVADYSGTFFRSDDGGQTWQRADLGRGAAQFAAGSSGDFFTLALDGILRSPDALGWETVYPLEEIPESVWLSTSDDGRSVCLVSFELSAQLEPSVTVAQSSDGGATWSTREYDAFALVQGAALSPDGRALALLGIRAEDLRHVFSVLRESERRWHHHPWPAELPETSLLRLLWSADGEAVLLVADTDVWLVQRPLERRPAIRRLGSLENPASALARAGNAGWCVASGTRLWLCERSGELVRLLPSEPERTLVALTADAATPERAGYAADVGGSVWSFALADEPG